MTFRNLALAIAVCVAPAAYGSAQAATIVDGLTFTVASSTSDTSVGDHFHFDPPGQAVVGRFNAEEERALSEFDLTGQGNAATALLTFSVHSLVGPSAGDFGFPPLAGTIEITAYQGNNAAEFSDYQATSAGTVGTFAVGGLSVGDVLSFDVTGLFNDAIDSGWSSLGIRLASVPLEGEGSMVFEQFQLTIDAATPVPEPAGLALLAAGLLALAPIARLRRRRG